MFRRIVGQEERLLQHDKTGQTQADKIKRFSVAAMRRSQFQRGAVAP
jgi:hypothetical protein